MPDYTIVRTKRKTLAIYIRPNGDVEVRCPRRTSEKAIEQAVRAREGWILEKQHELRTKYLRRQAFTLTEDSRLLLLGEEYPVLFGESCSFDGQCFTVPPGDFDRVRPGVIQLYKQLARELLPERVQAFSRQTGLKPRSVRISGASTRWGSCSGTNALSFSWRLILAPRPAVDYVIVHELAHIREHNHSARFWAMVESILPDYKEREGLLKALQNRLALENWDAH